MNFLGNKFVNENKGVEAGVRRAGIPENSNRKRIARPAQGTKQIFDEEGHRKDFAQWILEQKRLLMTDTTMRDAQQSLMATTRENRRHGKDRTGGLPYYGNNLFSLEMWGGATFDTAYRFLKRISVGKAGHAAQEDAEYSVPDADTRCERGRI